MPPKKPKKIVIDIVFSEEVDPITQLVETKQQQPVEQIKEKQIALQQRIKHQPERKDIPIVQQQVKSVVQTPVSTKQIQQNEEKVNTEIQQFKETKEQHKDIANQQQEQQIIVIDTVINSAPKKKKTTGDKPQKKTAKKKKQILNENIMANFQTLQNESHIVDEPIKPKQKEKQQTQGLKISQVEGNLDKQQNVPTFKQRQVIKQKQQIQQPSVLVNLQNETVSNQQFQQQRQQIINPEPQLKQEPNAVFDSNQLKQQNIQLKKKVQQPHHQIEVEQQHIVFDLSKQKKKKDKITKQKDSNKKKTTIKKNKMINIQPIEISTPIIQQIKQIQVQQNNQIKQNIQEQSISQEKKEINQKIEQQQTTIKKQAQKLLQQEEVQLSSQLQKVLKNEEKPNVQQKSKSSILQSNINQTQLQKQLEKNNQEQVIVVDIFAKQKKSKGKDDTKAPKNAKPTQKQFNSIQSKTQEIKQDKQQSRLKQIKQQKDQVESNQSIKSSNKAKQIVDIVQNQEQRKQKHSTQKRIPLIVQNNRTSSRSQEKYQQKQSQKETHSKQSPASSTNSSAFNTLISKINLKSNQQQQRIRLRQYTSMLKQDLAAHQIQRPKRDSQIKFNQKINRYVQQNIKLKKILSSFENI